MISNPVYNRFRLYFDQKFLLPEVEQKFQAWFERMDTPYIWMVDAINETVINADVPGIATQVQTQYEQRGTQRSYAGALHSEASIQKKLTIQFRVQNSFFTYFVMRSQITAFIDRWEKRKDFFLPDITLDILDDYGQIIFQNIYHEIVFESISGLSFKKSDVGISYKEFTCSFRYSNYEEISSLMDAKYANRDMQYVY